MKALTDIHQAVEKRIDEIRLTIHLHAHDYTLMRAFLEELGRPEEGERETYLDMGWEYGQLRGLIIQVHLAKEERFVVAEPILTKLLELGWTQSKQNEDASWGHREVTFSKPYPEPPLWWPTHKDWKRTTLTATVRMWPHPDSQLCKKVETGTKLTYKFVCEGDLQ